LSPFRTIPVDGERPVLNVISVDLEDYFHPTEVQMCLGKRNSDSLTSRVELSTARVLELFESRGVTATFFVLGSVARRCPGLIRRVASAGHEIACHSYAHRLVYEMTPDEFKRDTQAAKAAIEDACGISPVAYRAPSYSITEKSFWALEVLVECGFTHDSSICPIHHDRYGIPGFGRHAQMIETRQGPILEVPVATVQLSKVRVAPVGGGAYLRLMPYRYTAAGIRRINNIEKQPACIYFHPWEVDPGQPRLASGFIARVRTYTGLSKMAEKVERLLSDFRFSTVCDVYPQMSTTSAMAAVA
jgi:polysaccharide deacetylase family protein (PEP-CTERM system associated)